MDWKACDGKFTDRLEVKRMTEKDTNLSQQEDSAAFNRRFKYAIVAFSLIEFIVIALAVFYKVTR
jgi:large-conductance mechanosensitive channel